MRVLGILLMAASVGYACTTDIDCNDGNYCNGPETCQAGTCVSGYPVNCGPPIPNTTEWCDPLTGCRFQPVTSFTRCTSPGSAAFAWAQAESVCSCAENRTHGDYVRCVGRAAATGYASGLPGRCKVAIKRCAALSTCGKPSGVVTCCVALPGSCDGSFCHDGVTRCATAQDCPPRARCSLKPSAAACVAKGGSPGSGSCCDAVCGVQ